jgi:hypothetical protein
MRGFLFQQSLLLADFFKLFQAFHRLLTPFCGCLRIPAVLEIRMLIASLD